MWRYLPVVCLWSCAAPPPASAPCPTAPEPDPVAVVEVAPVETAPEEGACAEGDAAACEALFARYRVGHGVKADAELARGYQRRALELRLAGCARQRDADCLHLPSGMTPLALTPTAPPAEEVAVDVEPDRRLVSIDARGGVRLDGKSVQDLPRELERACAHGEAATVAADRHVLYREVVRLMDALQQAGCTRIALAVSSP